MGITLPVPLAPFEQLDLQGESITIEVDAKRIVIPTDNQYLLPSFNQWTENPSICDLTETPCGGLKNSPIQDTFPGSMMIEGNGCYLQTTDGTYTGKSIGAGKLSESSSIIDTKNTGIPFATKDRIEFITKDGIEFLLSPPSAIVESFNVVNLSTVSTIYTLTFKTPDSIESIELYNISTGYKEILTLTQISDNEYTFSKTIIPNFPESLQITVIYKSLGVSQIFSGDTNISIGLENMSESWIVLLPKSGSEIDFFHFSERPKQLKCKQDADGTISQITIFPGNGIVYHGRITHSNHTRVSGTGYVPNCLNKNIEGSITKFLQSHGMRTDFTSNAILTTWVVPAISDTKILPMSDISTDYSGDEISLRMSPGEYGCASFVVESDSDIKLELISSDLSSGTNSISHKNLDLKAVKCMYKANYQTSNISVIGKYITPVLLLHDDSLVQVAGDEYPIWNSSNPGGMNYLKTSNGEYVDITTSGSSTTNLKIYDADILQPVIITKNKKKQFWVNIHVPTGTTSGLYNGTIILKSGSTVLKQISIVLTVLPITLPTPSIEYSIYYRPKLTTSNIISSDYKNIEQMTAEIRDMVAHGITNPTIYGQNTLADLGTILQIRQQEGVDNTKLYYLGLNIDAIADNISTVKTFVSTYGVSELYIYGYDETDMNNSETRTKITNAHNAGAKVFCAQYPALASNISDVLDLGIISFAPDSIVASAFHTNSHYVFSYSNPQTTPEYPHTFRLNFGLLLWQKDYNGVMDYAYQAQFGADIWNDFDYTAYRDHCFAYPTSNGIVGTIQYEGYREASNDIKYLNALQNAISSHPGTLATTAQGWIDTLKTTNLSTTDLDSIRSQMIDYILQLQGV